MAYVYRHIRLDKKMPFYIGVGSDPEYRRANSVFGRNEIWKNIVAKTPYEVDIIVDNVSFEYALKKEIEFISLYGRIKLGTGSLANIREGGEGFGYGVKLKAETINQMRISRKGVLAGSKHPYYGKKRTDIEKRKISESITGCKNPMYGKNHSLEARAKISKSRTGRFAKDDNPNFKGLITVYKNGVVVGTFKGLPGCKEITGADYSCISHCLRGKQKTAKGYSFKREEVCP